MGQLYSLMLPPAPTLTEHNLPPQNGKVFFISGGTSGVGLALAIMLYNAGAKVWITGRPSIDKARAAIEKIKASAADNPSCVSPGEVEFLALDLSDLASIKPAVEDFLAKEKRLDVLWNNAGIVLPPKGSVSKQGHGLTMATNCLGPQLLTQLLLPVLERTAADGNHPPGSVRVVWASSIVVDYFAPRGAIDLNDLAGQERDQSKAYINSKTGNWFLASELARRVSHHGILSVTQNPGNLKTNIMHHHRLLELIVHRLMHEAKYGAYTELWAGLSTELNMEHAGCYIQPWGRVHSAPRKDMLKAMKSIDEGGTGKAALFWNWCEQQTKMYM